jgi:hypothetical protein
MVNGKVTITFLTARQATRRAPGHAAHWRVRCRRELSGLLAVLRLNEVNRDIEDYVLLPASKMTAWPYLRLSNASLVPGATRVETLADLIKQCSAQLSTSRSLRGRPGTRTRPRSGHM